MNNLITKEKERRERKKERKNIKKGERKERGSENIELFLIKIRYAGNIN